MGIAATDRATSHRTSDSLPYPLGLLPLHRRRSRSKVSILIGGFHTEETAKNPANLATLVPRSYAQQVRLAQELFAAVPGTLFISEFNLPYQNDLSKFSAMVDASLVQGATGINNGMGIGWPDSYLNPEDYTTS
jgi:hypothetical protein